MTIFFVGTFLVLTYTHMNICNVWYINVQIEAEVDRTTEAQLNISNRAAAICRHVLSVGCVTGMCVHVAKL